MGEVRQWPGSDLAFEVQMMAGRAAFGLEGWNDGKVYSSQAGTRWGWLQYP